MKKNILVALVFIVLSILSLKAQVTVAGSTSVNGTYATVSAAFTAINGGPAQTGNAIAITITANTTEPATGAVLNGGAWTSISIQPSGGAWTVSSAVTAGTPLLDFDGADNVTVDGLNSSGNALTIVNTTVSASAGTSTIRFRGDATSNTITRCTVNGASITAANTNGGTIFFGASAVSTGNDNNIVSFCDIGPSGANLPTKAIYGNGTTTSTATYNSGIQLLSNNIFDFFNATTQSNGIYLNAGNISWTIGNNKLYQTAARTQTTGSVHAPIQLANATGNYSMTISNNVIGYASSSGTGTYTLTGVASTRFIGIYFSAYSTVSSSTISGNTIAGISLSGSVSGTGASGTPFSCILASAASGSTLIITNNILGSSTLSNSLVYNSTSTGDTELTGIHFGTANDVTISGNTMGGLQANNSSTGAINFYAIRANTAASGTLNRIQNNTLGFAGATISCNSTGGAVQIIGIYSQTGTSRVKGNTIAYLSTSNGNAGTGLATGIIGILSTNTSTNGNSGISGNTIHSLSNTHATAATGICGIFHNGPALLDTIFGNNINCLSLGTSSATGFIHGINVNAGVVSLYNNMVRLGYTSAGASISTGVNIVGLYENSGARGDFYFNSVYIGGTSVTGTASSYAYFTNEASTTRTLSNNIFFNARSNGAGTGKHYAIRVVSGNTGLTSNYNDLFVSGTGGVLGLYSADCSTIAAWRSATGLDANSINYNPNYVNPTGSATAGDLHLANPTPVEAMGTVVTAVTRDFDQQFRSSFTPTDIGADAGNFTYIDYDAPVITYTVLTPTFPAGNRSLTATITDVTGVPTIGTLMPRVYYKKNTGSWFSSPGSLSSGTGTNGTWTFTILSADMGGLVGGDIVSYYVIAQDMSISAHLDCNPSAGFVAANVNTVTTPPTTPNTYFTSLTLAAGTYTVGATGNYPTLTAAVADFNAQVISGPIVMLLIDATYSTLETFPITINPNSGSSSVNTLTIRPQTTSTITGAVSGSALIRNLCSYVTFDGSNNSTTTRDLTISNTGSGKVLLIGSVSTATTQSSTIKNCILINTLNAYLPVIEIADQSGHLTGGYFSSISIQNNLIQKSSIGIYMNAVDVSGNGTGTTITQNLMNMTGADRIADLGIYAVGVDGCTISYNTLSGFTTWVLSEMVGISLDDGTSACTVNNNSISAFTSTSVIPVGIRVSSDVANSAIVISANSIFNLTSSDQSLDAISGIQVTGASGGITIERNEIYTIKHTYTGAGYGCNGIQLSSTLTAANITVVNNMISDVAGYGFNRAQVDDNGYGIIITSGGGYNIWHNSVSMNANQPFGGQPAALLIGVGVITPGSIDVRNNIFSYSDNNGLFSHAIHSEAPATVFSAINYNDYYTVGTNLGYIGGVQRTNLAAIQSGFGQNTNSLNVTPVFAAATNLHLPLATNSALAGTGVVISSVTNDLDDQSRNTCAHDIGADEFSSTDINLQGNSVSITDGDITPSSTDFTDFGSMSYCGGTIVRTFTIQNPGSIPLTISGVTITGSTAFTLTTAPATSVAALGSTTFVVTFDPAANTTYTATITINNSDCDEAVYNYAIQGSGIGVVINVGYTSTSCSGGSDGAANVIITSGTGPFTYLWSPSGNTGVTETGLSSSVNYTVVVTDVGGCTTSVVFSIPPTPAIGTSVSSQTMVTCYGGANGAATVLASGGTGPYTYSWAPYGGTGATATGLSANTYTCTVSDANSCTRTQTVLILAPSPITSSVSSQTNVSCNGGSNGAATITASGGAGGFTYSWSPSGGTAATATGLSAQVYTVTITDSFLCTSTQTVNVTAPTALTSSVSSQTNVLCRGSSTGAATISPSGGAGGYTYSWSPYGGTSATATGLSAQVYTVTITDANSCTRTQTVSITQPATAITSSISSSSNATCFGGSNGSATVAASGGTGAYTYAWTPSGGNAATASALAAGTYTCTITDANSCTRTQTVNITAPFPILITVTSQTNVTCNGGSNGAATISAMGGTGVLTGTWAPYGGNGPTATGLTAQTYTITLTDANSCTATQTVNITAPAVITSSISSSTNVSCFGESNGSTTVAASGGTGVLTYSWAPTGGNAATASGLAAGTYTCTITDANSCTRTQTVNITAPSAAITSSVSSQTNVACNGGANGAATISASGGTGAYTYAWAPSGGTAATATGLTAQVYTVTISDANSCTHTQTVNITAPTAMTVAVVSQTNVSCNGGSNGALTISTSGGTGPYSYLWVNTPGNSPTVTGLTAQAYVVLINDANSCGGNYTFSITQPAAITSSISSSSNVSCFGGSNGSATVSASGGTGAFTYVWTPSGGTAATASGLAFGTYTCTITDANSCTHQQTVTIAQPTIIASTVSSTSVTCFGGSNGTATVVASGGTGAYTYAWLPSGGTAATATGLVFGTYTCTITDVNSCTHQQTVSITQPTTITSSISSSSNVSCFGGSNGSATVSASGGTGAFTYAWVPSGGTAATASGLSFGTYTCTITDANSCTHQQTVTIAQPAVITSTVSASTNVSCFGGSNGSATVGASGGTGAFTYAWLPSGGNAATASGLAANTYTCTISDANGCTLQQTVTIAEPTQLVVTASAQTNIACSGGATGAASVNAAVGGTPGYTYDWAPGTPTGDGTTSVTGLTAGTWTCTVTDANSCVITAVFNVTQPTAVTASITSSTNVTCNTGNDGAATVSASGGTGSLAYNWLPSGGNASVTTGLIVGIYTVTVTDANLCTTSATVAITEPTAITSTVTATTDATCGSNNGSATISAAGGTGGLSYSWSSGGTAATETGLGAGSYTVTITDVSGCTHTQVATINNLNGPVVTLTASTNVSCFGGSDGAAAVSATGGTGILTYDWTGTPTGDGTPSVTGLTAGVWTCIVTDQNGCVGTQTSTITEPTQITSFVSAQNDVSCNGGSNGSATVTTSGGTGLHAYAWSSGSTTNSEVGVAMGTYTVTITDQNGCTHVQLVTITQPSAITAAVTSSTNVTCFGGNDGSADVTASGGTGTLSYSWAPTGGTAAIATGLPQGSYTCTITDVNGCSTAATVAITEPVQVTVSANVTASTVCAGQSVTFTGSGTATTYTWTGGVSDNVAFTPAVTDTYTVIGTDGAGCTNTATVTVVVNSLPAVTANATSVVVCNGDAVTFTGSGSSTSYTWSGGVTDGLPFTMTASDTYTVTGTDANGCSSTATITVTVNPIPVVGLGPDQALCSGTVLLDAQNAGDTYLWSDNTTAQTLPATTTGVYWVDVTNASGCTSRDSVTVTINSNPVVTLGNDTTICGTSVTLDAGNSGATYVWNDFSTAQTLVATTTGTYFVTTTLTGGCFANDTIVVTLNTPPVVTFTAPMDTMCDLDALVTLSGAPAGGSFAGPGVTGNAFDPATLSGTQLIIYSFTDINGCSASATDSVWVDICMDAPVVEINNGMNIYPNPNYGHFFVELNYVPTDVVTIEVTNALGQVVKMVQTSSSITELDIEMFEGGVYNVRVIDGGTVFVGRIVKE